MSANQNAPPAKWLPSRRWKRAAGGQRPGPGVGGVDVVPHDAEAVLVEGEVDVEGGEEVEGHDLQAPALLQRPRALGAIRGQEAVEERDAALRALAHDLVGDLALEVVLGEVGDARARVEVDRLVGEDAYAGDWGARQGALGVAKVDLEAEAATRVARLLARDPGAPRGAPPAQFCSVPDEVT